MQSLAINVECTPPDKANKKSIGAIKKIILLDPNIKINEATRIILDKFGLTHDKEASNYAICLRKDGEGKTKYLIPDGSRVVGSCLSNKVCLFNTSTILSFMKCSFPLSIKKKHKRKIIAYLSVYLFFHFVRAPT